ncbi:hypothetical protein C8Q77DRAFT_1060962, partial [Trametes polyzona]
DTTPRPDPMRFATLASPYYGLSALQHMPSTAAMTKVGRAEFLSNARELEERLLAMYALLNAGAPINGLPVELLVEIFALLQRGDGVHSTDWLCVLSVCRHWFVAGSTAAKLWRTIRVKSSTNLLRTSLARSRAAELDLRLMMHSTPDSFLLDFVSVAGPQAHRFNRLALGPLVRECIPAFSRFMENSMPALRFLQVAAVGFDLDPAPVLELPPARFPRLQELECIGFSPFSHPAIFAQLHEVAINTCHDPDLPTAAVVDALRTMRSVRQLTIRDVNISEIPGVSMVSGWGDRASLGKLQKLDFSVDGELMKQMLSAVVIPPSATLSLSTPYASELGAGVDSLREALPDDLESCLPVLSKTAQVHLITSHKQHRLEAYTKLRPCPRSERGTPSLSLSVSIPEGLFHFADALGIGDVRALFRDAPLQVVEITAPPADINGTDWGSFFDAYPKLIHFELRAISGDEPVGAAAFFSALDPGDASAGEGEVDTVVRCPDLQHLHLSELAAASTLLPVVVACLENRRRRLERLAGPALECLSLDLEGHADEEQYLETKAAFKERVGPLVGTLTYEDQEFDD